MIAQILFVILLGVTSYFAFKRFQFVRRNILLGRDVTPDGDSSQRWSTMARVALGQGKMFTRPLAAIMHLIIYAGFIIINIELLEIVLDGLTGHHRMFAFLGGFYNFLIASFEVLAFLVVVACVVFLARRNVIKLQRFWMREMTDWPRTDANLILVVEVLLMSAFLSMNACDSILQSRVVEHYVSGGSFPISSFLVPLFDGFSDNGLILIERGCWWFHIIGIFAFIVYVTYSKHLHIILAFPNTYFSKLQPAGSFDNLQSVTNEVKLMLDPSLPPPPSDGTPTRFGATDVFDLSWVNLMNAYSCTECGRCTAECPANQTGKLLSPRKIMMDTRDRLEEVGKKIDTCGGTWQDDGKTLLRDYISEEELWACTTCNACTNACPININPLEIIIDLRRYLIMEESKSPESITVMFNNIENNGAPWAMSAADRANWINN
jgi:hypothetical protein